MKKNYIQRLSAGLLCAVLAAGTALPARAAEKSSEQEIAAAVMRRQGVMVGCQDGDMCLEDGLTRTELAVILSRITFNQEHVAAEQGYYSRLCRFSDVPEWAKAHVGVCVSNSLMTGYGNGMFGAADPVTPEAACTVILRFLEQPETDWSYATARDKALELDLIPSDAMEESEVTRGDMAALPSFGNLPHFRCEWVLKL